MSTAAYGEGDALTAALLQISQHAERLALLDERETGHHRQITDRLAALASQLADTSARLDDISAATTSQATVVASLAGLDEQVAALVSRLAELPPAGRAGNGDAPDGNAYRPGSASPWWKLEGEQRQEAISRLRAWVEQVYRPGYGHLAAALGHCWEQHPLCLYGLDLLMELWSIHYLTPTRNAPLLASQAELQTRLLPALAEQMYTETTRCQHAQPAPARRPPSTPAAVSDDVQRRRPPAS